MTTNFALTYYTVESDVASNGIDAYIISIGTDGIGVQASVAGGQLNPTKIKDSFGETDFKFERPEVSRNCAARHGCQVLRRA